MNSKHKMFEEIVSKHYKMVFRICHYILGNKECALEAAQETFKRIFESIDVTRSKGDMFKYVRSAAYNTARLYMEKQKNFLKFCETKEDFDEERDDIQLEPLESLILDEHRQLLHEALQQIEDKYRDVLVLHYYLELPYESIAKRLGMTVNNVRVRIHRAKSKLRKRLEPKMRKEYGGREREAL